MTNPDNFQKLVAHLQAFIKKAPEEDPYDCDPMELYCGNEDDARRLGEEAAEHRVATQMKEWLLEVGEPPEKG